MYNNSSEYQLKQLKTMICSFGHKPLPKFLFVMIVIGTLSSILGLFIAYELFEIFFRFNFPHGDQIVFVVLTYMVFMFVSNVLCFYISEEFSHFLSNYIKSYAGLLLFFLISMISVMLVFGGLQIYLNYFDPFRVANGTDVTDTLNVLLLSIYCFFAPVGTLALVVVGIFALRKQHRNNSL